jgi:hypothetical protein
MPCPVCNLTEPPAPGPDFVSLVRGDFDYDAFVPTSNMPTRLSVGPPGELLFEFVRASDRAPITCELRFNGESYGWEAQFFDRGELWYAHGLFVTKAFAIQWAEEERKVMQKGTSSREATG